MKTFKKAVLTNAHRTDTKKQEKANAVQKKAVKKQQNEDALDTWIDEAATDGNIGGG